MIRPPRRPSWLTPAPTDTDDILTDEDYAAIASAPAVESIYEGQEQAAEPAPTSIPPAVAKAPPPVMIRPRKASEWATWRHVMPSAERPVRIAGQHLGRTSLVIRNLDAGNDVTVGPDDDVTAGVHFVIAAGGQVTFEHTAPVWAISAAGQTPALLLLAEYDVETGGA